MHHLVMHEGSHVLVPDLRGFGASRDQRQRDFHEQMEEIEGHFGADAEALFGFSSRARSWTSRSS